MFDAMSIFIEYPLLAFVPVLVFVALYRVSRRRVVIWTGLLWFLYGLYEYAMHERILCSGECNIRVDLLAIYPVLALASAMGLGVACVTVLGRRRGPSA